MSSLNIQHIHKSFGESEVLQDINIAIEEHDFLVLVGPSGCGKSTLLNIIAGLEQPTSGDIKIAGKEVTDLHPAMRDIAMVFQSYALYPNMNVYQNMAFGLEMHKVPKAERQKRVQEAAEKLQIDNLLNRKPAALSGGQRQRVAMGRALVRRPRIFLFDEPLSNLDAKLRVDMRSEIKRLHREFGATIVYVTHDQIEAMTLSTKIAVMNKGIVQQFGSADDIYRKPKNIFVATFMGSPAMNIFDAEVIKSRGKAACKIGSASVPLPNAAIAHVGKPIKLGIRPEDIIPGAAKDNKKTSISGKIDLIEPTGPDCFVIFSTTDGTRFTVRTHSDFQTKHKTGERINLQVATKDWHLFSAEGERIE